MRNLWFFSIVTATLLCAGDRVEFIGSSVDSEGSVITATSHPTMIYQDQIVSAETLTYDRNTSIIEAVGSVNTFKAGQYHAISEYSKINLNEETRHLKPYYAIDTNSSLWMSTEEANGCKNKIDLVNGMLSGCDSSDPLWKIHFSSADYDGDSMWMNLYNARLFVQDVPLMYLPYFGYPTDRTRRSGLLIPSFGFSSAEGFYYEQPIYWAPTNWFDAEFRPQIRTTRGAGLYADFRFVDSPVSKGSFNVGYFNEQESYIQEYDLAHDQHYGYGLDYYNSAFLREWFGLSLEGESGLYVHGKWMNDVDYLNLQESDQTLNTTANQLLSRINGYYNSEDNYVGAYVKYYQYLDQSDNTQTLQTLPSLQYHRYLESLAGDHLLMSGDVTANNFYRPEGMSALQADVTLPVELQTSLMDEYLDASYTANLSARAIGFYGNPVATGETRSDYSSGYYTQLDHTFSLGSTLVRSYDGNTRHVMSPNVSYTLAGQRMYSGYYEKYHNSQECVAGNNKAKCDFYTLNNPSDGLSLGFNNYLFNGSKVWLVDRLSQTFRYDDIGSYSGELQNELEWEISDSLSYYNQTSYNHDRERITKEQNTLRYNNGVISGSVSHYYTDEVLYDNLLQVSKPEYSSYWNAELSYQYDRYYKFFGLMAYDYQEDLFKRGEVGFLYTQRCLDFGLRFVQNRRPILTNTLGSDSISDSYVFITVILKPLGGSEFNYKLTNN